MANPIVSWWLKDTVMPDLHWARLQVHKDGSAYVLDENGEVHKFRSKARAVHWLYGEIYLPFDYCLDTDRLPEGAWPPDAESEEDLVAKMQIRIDPRWDMPEGTQHLFYQLLTREEVAAQFALTAEERRAYWAERLKAA